MNITIAMTILAIGLGRGFLHALDPDHILTISALSARNSSEESARPLRYAILWWAGHSCAIITIAALLFVTGQHLPATVSASTEVVVGVVMMTIAVSVFWSLRHQATGQERPDAQSSSAFSASTPLMIGSVHGLAGSASLLALIPVAFMDIAPGIAFVVVFCAGVLFAMLVFSILFERLEASLLDSSPRRVAVFQAAIAMAAFSLGAYWTAGGLA